MSRNYIAFNTLDENLKDALNIIGAKQLHKPLLYDLSKTEPASQLLLFYLFSNNINFKETEKYIEEVHNINNHQTQYQRDSKTQLTLKKFVGNLNNKSWDYSEYLRISNKFKITSFKTSNLILKDTDINHSYFSKPFILTLNNKYEDNDIVQLSTAIVNNDKSRSHIVIDIYKDNNGNKDLLDSYNISYIPPNGGSAPIIDPIKL